MNFISTAINTAKEIMDKVESQEEIDRLGREVSLMLVIVIPPDELEELRDNMEGWE